MQLILKNPNSLYRKIVSDYGALVKRYDQIKKIFKEDSVFFAFPKFNNNEIEWYTGIEGNIIQYINLNDTKKNQIKIKLKTQVEKLYNTKIIKDDEDYYNHLEKIIEIPSYENINIIDDEVVLTNWGYIEDRYDAPRHIIKELIKNVDIPIVENKKTKKEEIKNINNQELQGKHGDPRVNLSWNSENDLDLYVIDPCGNQIDYTNHKQVCNEFIGILDLDANALDHEVKKEPQENIVWENGGSKGSYRVLIKDSQNRNGKPTPYNLTIVNNGNTSYHEGIMEISEFTEIISFLH